MCHKLLQVYACGHLKTICITPCPHAIATGLQVPNNHENTPELSRSSSVVSSMTSSSTALPMRRSDVQGLPSQRVRDAQAHASPLRAAVLSGQARQQQQGGGNTPAFRFVTPGTAQETMGNGLEYVQTHPASPASQSPTSPSSNHPSPTLSTTGTLVDAPLTTYTPSPSAFFTLADPEINTRLVTSFYSSPKNLKANSPIAQSSQISAPTTFPVTSLTRNSLAWDAIRTRNGRSIVMRG
jgi:hypothetical protein